MRRAVRYSIVWLVLWACGTTAVDIPISSNYVLKKQDSCPAVGYYFRREPSPNAVDPGPCLLCFCTEPGMAACWQRDSKRCNVENFVMNTTSDLSSRARRSPILGLSDIFFKDATKDFFEKSMPQECKPSQESFSEGCPPADWCIGCTVCDCDANGRWDCHILSFCNKEERKKQLENGKLSGKNILRPSSNKTGKQSSSTTKKRIIPAKPGKKPSYATKPVKKNSIKKVIKRVIKTGDNKQKKVTGKTKPPKRKIIIKKHVNNKTIKQRKENPKEICIKKLTNKEVMNESAQKANIDDQIKNNILIEELLASAKNMIRTEIERINKTTHEKYYRELKKKNRKLTPREKIHKIVGEQFRWMRGKRDIGNEPTSTVYDNDIDTTTYVDTEERKKQFENGKLSGKNILRPSSNKTGKQSSSTTKKRIIPAKPGKTPVKKTKKPSYATKPVKKNSIKKVIKRVIKTGDNKKKKVTGKTKPKRKIIIKKHVNNKTIRQKKENPKEIYIKKLTNKEVMNASAQRAYIDDQIKNNILIKELLASAKNAVRTEIERINKTTHEKYYRELKKKNRKLTPREKIHKKVGDHFRWMRSKRDIGNEPTSTEYDNDIDTTTYVDTGSSYEIDKNTIQTNAPDEVIPITFETLLSTKMLKNDEDLAIIVRPLEKTTESNISENKSRSNDGNVTILKFQIVVNDDQNATLENLEKNSVLNDELVDKSPLMSSYKYNIDNDLIENSIQISTTVKPNITEKNLTKVENLKKYIEKITDGTAKNSVTTNIISKSYRNLTDIYFRSKNISTESKVNISMLTIHDGFNKTRKSKSKMSFLKYMKKILKKLVYFGKKSNCLGQEDEYEIVKMLCDNKKSCKVNKRNKKILKNKIKKINHETKNIFRTIKIIKGLLQLIDGPNSYKNGSNFKNDIKKLNAILKIDFLDGKNFSTTQRAQIAYLKSNTKTLINTVSRFITLINEVTAILQRKNKQEVIKTATHAKQNMTESFEKIKKILIKHKLVENTFINKIYSMLTDLEVTVSNKTKVSDTRMNSYVIDKYSRNIIDNLRKLRDLAQQLNSRRKKRHITGDDDTMEYLLILLEYLLKKDAMASQINKREPVMHDGIDVLIDTIKNAPDIKDIKKKVIKNASQFPNIIQKVSFRASDENDTATIESNQNSDSNSASKEINTPKRINTLMELKSEELKGKYSSETRGSDKDEDQSKNNSDILYHDYPQGARSSPQNNPVQNVSSNPNRNPTEESSDNPYPNLTQESDVYPDLAQNMKENSDDNTQLLSRDLKVKYSLKDDIRRVLKENSKDESIPNLNDNPQNSKTAHNSGEFTEKENLYDDGLILDIKYMPNKDIIITQDTRLNNVTSKIISNEDATQIVRAKPLEDHGQNVYYDNVDENTTYYASYENVTELTEKTTSIKEKIGFEKFETSADRLESDSDYDDTYYAENGTRKAQDKVINKDNNNQTVDEDDNQSDSIGNLEWIEANFGTELQKLKENFGFLKKETAVTEVIPVTTTIKSIETQTVDLNDVYVENEGKKGEKTLNADEVLYQKQLDLFNSLDYGTEKNDFEETKSDDETTDSIYA